MKEPACVAETLKWCNDRRKEQGREPLNELPKGRKFDPHSCPCGKATGINVYTKRISDPKSGLELPSAVAEFVEMFDAGLLPEYEE